MTRAQCRVARVLLGWSQTELGRMAGVSKDTVLDYEVKRKEVRPATLTAMESALVRAGVVFLDIPGRGVGVLVDEGAFAAKPEAHRFDDACRQEACAASLPAGPR